MPTCPVCENAQEGGDECAVCGRLLVGGSDPGARVEPVEGLEPTLFADSAAPAEHLEGLEPTSFDDVAVDRGDPVDVEPTLAAPVEARVEPLEDIERTGASDVPDELELEPAAAACRYCRSALPPSAVFCPRCGMRAARAAAPPAAGTAAPAVCSSCGTPAAGAVCRACGARMPA